MLYVLNVCLNCAIHGAHIKMGIFYRRVKKYFYENLGAPFIVVFQILILACAFSLIVNAQVYDFLAVLAFCFLALGILLQAVAYIRLKAVDGENFGRSS